MLASTNLPATVVRTRVDVSCSAGTLAGKSITEMAAEHDVTPRALRYYENIGLLSPFRDGWARKYSPTEEQKLEFIQRSKKLGCSLADIKNLLGKPQPRGCEPLKPAMIMSAEQIENKIALLESERAKIAAGLEELYQAQDLGRRAASPGSTRRRAAKPVSRPAPHVSPDVTRPPGAVWPLPETSSRDALVLESFHDPRSMKLYGQCWLEIVRPVARTLGAQPTMRCATA